MLFLKCKVLRQDNKARVTSYYVTVIVVCRFILFSFMYHLSFQYHKLINVHVN